MKLVNVEVEGQDFEGHWALTGDGSLRVISRYGSRSVPLGELQLPSDIQAEMVMAEIVAAFRERTGSPGS